MLCIMRECNLVVTETEHPVNGMDFIAVENAVTALKQEFVPSKFTGRS